MTVLKQSSLQGHSAGRFLFRQASTNLTQPVAKAAVAAEGTHSDQSGADRDDELARLKASVLRLSNELALAESKIEAARVEGRSEGYERGLAEAGSREDERFTALKDMLHQCVERFSEGLFQQRDLAIELAVATLDTILGHAEDRPALVTAIASKWVDELGHSGLVQARVSAEDFGDEERLGEICRAIGQTKVAVDPSLPSGSCFLDLSLGCVDASLAVQADAARSFLLEHALMRTASQ